MAKELEIGSIKAFDSSGDPTSVAPRWKRWKRSFEYFIVGKGVENDDQKQALLLHCAGESVQTIFEGLDDFEVGDGETKYKKTLKVLDDYFIPKANIPYERHLFRNMKQENSETIDQFVSRLRIQALNCDFGAAIDENIRDQIIDKCNSPQLRTKLLAKGANLELKEAQDLARALETAQVQARKIEQDSKGEVNFVHSRDERKQKRPSGKPAKTVCYRCGKEGHISRDVKCPARNATCKKCKKVGHFAIACKTKTPNQQQSRTESKGKSGDKVNEVEEGEYNFSINLWNSQHFGGNTVTAIIGGVRVDNVLVDSGATCNIIDKKTWEYLKENKVICTSKKSQKSLYPYGSNTPLEVLGEFKSIVSVNNVEKETVFVVVNTEGKAILGCKTSEELGVLKINTVNAMTVDDVVREFPECFKGVGKLTNYQAKIHVDPNVNPVAQQYRRLPFSMRDKVEAKLEELVSMDIIEEVQGPTPWVSPIVVVPKSDGDIRLCVDMRQANTAIVRERYPIPTIDEVLESLNESTLFTKLDLKWGFHQIELETESRKITTFATHKGLFQYKRLMFGISSAPEMYQHIIQQVLTGCDGASNIADDIIVHGKDLKDHDIKLRKTLERLKERGLTLSKEKCQFKMPKLTFMGYLLSQKGIGPTEERVKAVKQFRAPNSASEVRSFLGLVNFSARFIPNLATMAEPLRKLTRKDVPFKWGQEQQKAFEALKESLEKSETLSYFDKNAKTKVITDASPVGVGAVLVQEKGGVDRAVCYASRSLSDVESRYSQTEKEALAIVWACERFDVYLYGIDFELFTDHKPLEYIYSERSKPSARVERWVLRLQPYHFTVKYIPGPNNIADALSRLIEVCPTNKRNKTEEYVRFVAANATPAAISMEEIEKESAKDKELIELRKCILSDIWDTCPVTYKSIRHELCVCGHLILRGTRLVIPAKLRKQVVELGHEGHQGMVKTKQRLRSKVWWPGIDRDAESKCKTCHECQLVSLPSPPEPVKTTKLPTEPWQDVAADLLGPMPTGEHLLVVVDYFTRFYEVVIMNSVTANSIIKALEPIFARYGYPLSIKTDNGPQFVAETFETYLKQNCIEHRRSTPYWPQANGEVERQNRSLLKAMKIAKSQGKDWRQEINTYLLAYRTTPHSTTGTSPAELMFGRKIHSKIPDIRRYNSETYQEVRDKDAEMKQRNKDYADAKRHAKENSIKVGDKILLEQTKQNKLSTNYEPIPYEVIGKFGSQAVIKSQDGVEYKRNTSHMKLLKEEIKEIEPELEVPEPPTEEVTPTTLPEDGVQPRPKRDRRPPAYLKDYVLGQ